MTYNRTSLLVDDQIADEVIGLLEDRWTVRMKDIPFGEKYYLVEAADG